MIATASDHPGSIGGFSAQRVVYDVMGQVIKTSNPTETSASGNNPAQWTLAGDDAGPVWIYTQQTYDWKGRPRITTNPDGKTKEASYAGCGCAGGEVVTLTDEGTLVSNAEKKRQQKIYSDVLGRTWKTEIRNWDGSGPNGTGDDSTVYSTSVTTFNARDQVTQIRQYAGAEGSGAYQDTTMTYDGYGRLKTRHLPEQQVDPNNPNSTDRTTWTYNPDDTLDNVKDARGAITTFGYVGTNRHLVKSVTHTISGGPTLSATFNYDAVGNRTSMTDGLGSATYIRNQLSQLTVETRTFTVGHLHSQLHL